MNGQVLQRYENGEYPESDICLSSGKKVFNVQKTELADEYVRREIEEAVQKVVELG